jgi:hypothetical protein
MPFDLHLRKDLQNLMKRGETTTIAFKQMEGGSPIVEKKQVTIGTIRCQ